MYPLLLGAPLKDYIWGGNRLKNEFGFESDKDKIAEAWVLSCHKDGENVILNGEFKGKTLTEVLDIWGKDSLGKNSESFNDFPILIKLIDACDKLSVQVHPSDEYALKVEGEFGKTECWYIVDCEPDAKLLYGFSCDITKEEFAKRIEENTLDDVVNYVNVKKGDFFFIPSGTLHAIGKGILIAEVQQNSNTTYRVSDYGRLGADGKPRPLHVEKAKEVTTLENNTLEYGSIGEITYPDKKNSDTYIRKLIECDKFAAEILSLKGSVEISDNDSFVSLVVLDGEGELIFENERIDLKKGSSVFIPCKVKCEIIGNAQFLKSYL